MAKFNWHLSNLGAFIRLNIFVKITLQDWLDKPFEVPPPTPPPVSTQGIRLSKNQKSQPNRFNPMNFLVT